MRKYFFWILLITIVIIGSIGGTWYYVNSASDSSCANLQPGDLVRLQNDVYWFWLDNDKNLIQTSAHLQNSWGKIFAPKIISAKCFDSLGISNKKINYRPGTYLIKYRKTNQLYAILPGNKFARIDANTAKYLYGDFTPLEYNGFMWMNTSNRTKDIATNTPHAGMLISSDNKKTIYYVDENLKLHLVTPAGFTANKFYRTFVHNIDNDVINKMDKLGTIDKELPHLTDKTQTTAPQYPPLISTVPTYTLSASTTTINEGNLITITLTTTNVVNDTNIAYTITGINNSDLSSGSLTGNFVIHNNKATKSFILANDTTTEGTETMHLNLNNDAGNINITINDTSLTSTVTSTPSSSYGTIYYVRTDGGTASQCDGKTNTALSPDKHCAWSHPFIALPPGGTAKIAGGDTLIIGNGSYKMGTGAPETIGVDKCNANWSYDCIMTTIPSGPSPDKPTRILGANWNNGCSIKPQLWGSGRPWTIIDITGSNNVELQCLEITDHSSCVEFHSGGLACNRNNPPFGDWASSGLRASDSSNVLLKNLDIHGLAHTGIYAGRLTNWTIAHTKIQGNGWVGWDGDIDGNDSNNGTIKFSYVNIDWNGCGETYPGRKPTGCWGQSAGGYGDGLGTGTTGGNWTIEHSTFLNNTSDGLDLLYHRLGGTITINDVRAEGNAGNQIKTTGSTSISNSIVIGNCGYFSGKSFTYNVDNCRAAGNALSLNLTGANNITINQNSVYSQGDCLVLADKDGGGGTIIAKNNVFLGDKDFTDSTGEDKSCLFYSDSNVNFNNSNSKISGTKNESSDCSSGTNNSCDSTLSLNSIFFNSHPGN